MFFSFGFRCHLSTREMTEVAFFLSLLEECSFRVGSRDVHVWKPNSIDGFSCKFFFRMLLDLFPHSELVL